MHILSFKQCKTDFAYIQLLSVAAAANPHQMQQQIPCLLGSFCMLLCYLWFTYHGDEGDPVLFVSAGKILLLNSADPSALL